MKSPSIAENDIFIQSENLFPQYKISNSRKLKKKYYVQLTDNNLSKAFEKLIGKTQFNQEKKLILKF